MKTKIIEINEEPEENEEMEQTNKNEPIISNKKCYIIILNITIYILLMMGRHFYCKNNDIHIWNDENSHLSQHFLDPYSLVHILQGILLFSILNYINIKNNLLLTLIFASTWEILENTSYIIESFRQDAIQTGYYGDSVINSIGDIFCCIVGWYVSKFIGYTNSVILYISIECVLITWIGDNLTKIIFKIFF